jgi:hypothetical protein
LLGIIGKLMMSNGVYRHKKQNGIWNLAGSAYTFQGNDGNDEMVIS